MANNGVIIQGSARSIGNTRKAVEFVAERTGFEVIDLKEFKIAQFEYDFSLQNDDFLPLIRKIIEQNQTIVFATPVYWYSMSGLMKAFFDRITELLMTEKELGRKLRGKNMAMISCSSGEVVPNGFSFPFSESANYLGMKYLGDVHTWVEEDKIPKVVEKELECFSKILTDSN